MLGVAFLGPNAHSVSMSVWEKVKGRICGPRDRAPRDRLGGARCKARHRCLGLHLEMAEQRSWLFRGTGRLYALVRRMRNSCYTRRMRI